MGIFKKQKRAMKRVQKEQDEARKEKIKNYLKEIEEISKRHKLMLVPFIDRYGARFEVQDIKGPETKAEEKKEEK